MRHDGGTAAEQKNFSDHVARFRLLLDDFPAAAYICNSEGLISYFNAEASALWGREPALNDPGERFCGSYRLFLADGAPISHDKCWMALALQNDRQYVGREIIVGRADNSQRSALAYATPIHDDGGGLIGAVNVLFDMTDRQRTQLALEENEIRLQAVIDTVVDGILTIDETGVVLSINPAGVRLFGYKPVEVVGHNVSMLMPEPFNSQHDEYLRSYLRTGKAKIIGVGREVEGLRKDGSTFPMYLAVSEATLSTGRIFTGIVRDISDRIAADEALLDADRRKDEFIATLAHELRNPLAPLQAELDVSRLSNFDPAIVARSHEIMERQVRHLARFVDDLLDLSRIAHGKLALRKTRIELGEVLEAVLAEVRGMIDEAGQLLVWNAPKQDIVLDADPVRLGQVFLNLLSNASKYTPREGRIELRAERLEDVVRVSVRDDGLGIPDDKLESVFEMFSQIDRSLETGYRGLGIGLSLVKRLVEMHGGRIEAQSEGLGKGSEFTLWIPVSVDSMDSPATTQTTMQSDAAPGTCRRVLLVEDNRDVVRALSRLIRFLGHELRVAFDGERAIDVATRFRPEVILMDIGLPKRNGYDTARKIRAQAWSRNVRLVAVTGWGQADDRQRAREAGFDEHVTKPVDLETLRTLLS